MRWLLLLVTLAFASGCSPMQGDAEKNVERNGIRFETFRDNPDGTKTGDLAADTVIEGWPCRRGFVAFHADWRLDECHLAREYERNGVVMPAETRVFPDQRGNPGVVLFPNDRDVQGYRVRGTPKGGFMTAFYPDGRLHWFYPRDDIEVDGVSCAANLFDAVYLHSNGHLQQCKLAASATVDGETFRKGGKIRLDEDGMIIK